jgi:hypothetical protein
MAHCGCTTCLDARRAAEDRALDRHGEIVGNLLGLETGASENPYPSRVGAPRQDVTTTTRKDQSMNVRAKFKVVENAGGKIVLRPEYDHTIPEDQRFAQATPSGEILLQVDNPSARTALTLGNSFYVDFSPATGAVNEAAGADPRR